MTSAPALLASLVVLGAGWAWVRPAPCTPRARPRQLPHHSPDGRPSSRGCPPWFRAMAEAAVLPLSAEQAWTMAVGAVLAAVVFGAILGGPGLAILASVGLAAGGWVALRAAGNRLDAHVARAVPDTLDAVARSTRAGLSLVQALAALDQPGASPSDRVLAAVAAQVGRGVALPTALANLAASTTVPAVHLAATALIVGSETGAAPARAVEGVAATLRDRLALERELAAQSSQARASVAVLVLAPLMFGLFAMATDPRVGHFLLRSPMGWVCLVLGLGLNGLGALWMRRIMADVR